MNKSELVTPQHLRRKALIYIRQSHPNSVISHQESLRLQYALKQRAINLGWSEESIQIIDSDLGLTATYDRNQARGIPRRGEALLHGIVYCGECGHKMVVQYKDSPHYICNYLRQQYGVPVCQYIPTPAVDAQVVANFLEALSPVELDAYERAIAAQKETLDRIDIAHEQQLQRLRYEAQLPERQFRRVDPDNRLVAAELERRWEEALRAKKQRILS